MCYQVANFPLTNREKLFYSIQYNNASLATSDLFHMFTQSIKFYTIHYDILKGTDGWKGPFVNLGIGTTALELELEIELEPELILETPLFPVP